MADSAITGLGANPGVADGDLFIATDVSNSNTDTKLTAAELATYIESKLGIAALPDISSGAGAPGSTPTKVGDVYIDTTGDDAYIAVGTASSGDWEKSNDGVGGGGGITVTSGAGAPGSTPGAVGDIYVDTTGDDAYVAVGTASSADWEKSEPDSAVTQLGAATLADIGTPAATDKVLVRDASDSNALKEADFSEFGGGGGGAVTYPALPQILRAASSTLVQLPVGPSWENGSLGLYPRFMPMPIAEDLDDPQLEIYVSTAGDAGSLARIGAYLWSTANSRFEEIDQATVDATSIGRKSVTLTGATLPQGVIYTCCTLGGTGSVAPVVYVANDYYNGVFWGAVSDFTGGSNSQGYVHGALISDATADLPATIAPAGYAWGQAPIVGIS